MSFPLGPRRRAAALTALGLLATAALAGLDAPASAGSAHESVFTYTGGPQTFVVPPTASTLQVTAIGAAGGASGDAGPPGTGDAVEAYLAVGAGQLTRAGDRLLVVVGQTGRPSGERAFNGGGAGGSGAGAGGGGGTDLRRPGGTLADRLVVAGGGGGGGGERRPEGEPSDGGSAGMPGWSGDDGRYGGQPGTDVAGGRGAWDGSGASGRVGQGGDGEADGGDNAFGGGGGGGGYFGGGGGGFGPTHNFEFYSSGGGGGGSSWTAAQVFPSRTHDTGSPASLTLRWWDGGPTVSPHQDVSVPATGPRTAVAYSLPSASDAGGRTVDVSCLPESGASFPVGRTPVSCLATAADGAATVTGFDVVVRDRTAPVVSALGNREVAATGRHTHVGFAVPKAVDAVDGPRPVRCTPAAGSSFPVGVTPVRCTASDTAGNVGVASGTVTVRDRTAPRLSRHPEVRVSTAASVVRVSYAVPYASDAVDGRFRARCLPASSTLFRQGQTPVTCTARDRAGNAVSSTFAVVVAPR